MERNDTSTKYKSIRFSLIVLGPYSHLNILQLPPFKAIVVPLA